VNRFFIGHKASTYESEVYLIKIMLKYRSSQPRNFTKIFCLTHLSIKITPGRYKEQMGG